MQFPLFISKRISVNEKGSFSHTINKIAIVSITVAIAALVLSFTILHGFEREIKNKIYSFSGHLIISKYTLSSSFEENIEVTDSLTQAIEALPGIQYLSAYAYKAALLKANDEVQGIVMKGVDENADSLSYAKHIIAGRFPNFPEKGYGLEVMVSKKIAGYLHLNVGDDIMIFFIQEPPRYRKLKLVGIYETGLEDFDEKTIVGDINLVRRINGWNENQAGGIEVYLDNTEKMDEAEDLVFDQTGSDLYVDKVSDKYPQIFDWLILMHQNVNILLVIILTVACFNMVSILLILIMERTQMIGTLKALGATGSLMRQVFLFNGIRLIGKGLLFGNLIGLGVSVVQYYFKIIPLDSANYYMDHVPVGFHFGTILMMNLLAVAVIGVTLLLPLLVIDKISPIKAIRFD